MDSKKIIGQALPKQWQNLLPVVKEIFLLQLKHSKAYSQTQCDRLSNIIRQCRNSFPPKQSLPRLNQHSDGFKEKILYSALFWLSFPRSGGKVLYDSFQSKYLSHFPFGAMETDAVQKKLLDYVCKEAGISESAAAGIQKTTEFITSNLDLKQAITSIITNKLQKELSNAELFHQLTSCEQLPDSMVDIIVTESCLFFVVPYSAMGLTEDECQACSTRQIQAFSTLLHDMALDDPLSRHHFPAVGHFRKERVEKFFLADLCAEIHQQKDKISIPDGIILDTLGTMTFLLPKEHTEMFLVHDAWGHSWQETLCDFEHYYFELSRLSDPVDLHSGPFMKSETSRLIHAFSIENNRTHLQTNVASDILDNEFADRLDVAINAIMAEFLADITEYTFQSQLLEKNQSLPSTSKLQHLPLFLDLSFNDCCKHIKSIENSVVNSLSPQHKQHLIEQLTQAGFPQENLDTAINDLLQMIDQRYKPYFDTSEIGILSTTDGLAIQWIYCQILQLYDSIQGFLNKNGTAYLQWLVLAIAVFYQGCRRENFWVLDQLSDNEIIPFIESIMKQLNTMSLRNS